MISVDGASKAYSSGHAESMHTHGRHVSNLVGAPNKNLVFHKNEFLTRFVKLDACEAGGGGGGVLVSFFYSHSLKSTRRAHFIDYSNSLLR
jgi:hypothetical protein